MTRILGIDCSSTTIGYGVLDIDANNNISLVAVSYLKPNKKGSIIERIVSTRDEIQKIMNKYQPDLIGIEDIIQFMQGKSTAKTIITLTTFNRMIGLCAFDFLKKSPSLFNVMTIRHGLKLNKTLPKKEDIPELVAHHLKITFPYERSAKGKKKGAIKIENFDMADGLAVALYYAFIVTGKIKRKNKVL
jgi:Holliday junction resolvasome RuvABC endonuclease subunit